MSTLDRESYIGGINRLGEYEEELVADRPHLGPAGSGKGCLL